MTITTAHEELSPFVPENIALVEDYFRTLEMLEGNSKDQYYRRMLLRSAFAYMEGIIFVFKGSTAGLLLAQHFQEIRSDMTKLLRETPYLGFLTDSGFVLSDKGELKPKKEHINLKTNIQYMFKIAATTYHSSYEVDKSGNGWECFQKSIKVRDRITHPKNSSDMEIAEDEISDVIKAISWFEEAFDDLFSNVDIKKFLNTLTGPAETDVITEAGTNEH